nr:alanine:cation symporter family protein [Oscillospiraceae bacterium]
AVFWMWVSAVLGMMTGYAENVLGIFYRKKDKSGVWRGGAMRYIREGLSERRVTKPLAKPLSIAFAGLCVLAALGMGDMAQMNAAAEALKVNFGAAPLVTGIVLAGCAAAVMAGGVKRIGSITAKIVPLMSGFYMIGSLYILLANAPRIPAMLCGIFESALGLNAVGGGVAGFAVKKAVSYGIRRGVFSNEAGLGTSVSAHAASDVKEPAVQGMWSVFEVFFDTIVMCSLTAFVLLASPCRVPPASEVLNNLTTETQYFALTESGGLISAGAPLPLVGSGEELRCHTAYGGEFTLALGEGEITFSNIMSVRGIQSRDASGNLLWLDADKTRPLIETAEIAPLNGVGLATHAFSGSFGGAAGKLLAVAVLLFAFSTVIGWSHFGAEAAVFLFGERAVIPFRIAFVVMGVVGACIDLGVVWDISDTINGLMAIPNLFAVLCLSGKVLDITRNYEDRVFRRKSVKPLISAWGEVGASYNTEVKERGSGQPV